MSDSTDTTGLSKAKPGWLILIALLVAAILALFDLPTQNQLREEARQAAAYVSKRMFHRPPARPPYYRVEPSASGAPASN